MRAVAALVLLIFSLQCYALSDKECKAYTLYREANLEPIKGQRAVLSVINNRMTRDKASCFKVMTQKGQFSFYRRGMKLELTPKMVEQYNRINKMNPVLGEDYLFFHSVKIRPSWSRNMHCKRIENHKFCRLIK